MISDPHSELQGIAAFVHAVDSGSFTAAASRMALSKSAVAKAVARLEERLGARLLERTTRRARLTPEGERYYATCVKVLEELSAAESELAAGRQEPAGLLRVNLPVSYGRLCVMPILLDMATRYPKLRLDITFADRRVDLVEEGIDLVVRLGDAGDQASLVGRRIGWQRSVICAAPDYLARRGTPESYAALSTHDCLGFTRDGRASPWSVPDGAGGLRALAIAPRHSVTHGEALRDAAVAGLGIAYLSTWLAAPELADGRLVPLLFTPPVEQWPIWLLWPRTRDLAPKLRVVVDALAARLG